MNGMYAGISGKGILEFIVLLIVFAFVLFITYYVTKFIGNIQKTQMTSGNIQIIESRRLMGNKQLAIIKVGDDYFLIGIGKDEIQTVGKIDGEKLDIKEQEEVAPFSEVLERIKNIREKKK